MSRVSPQMVQLTLYSCTESKTSGESDFSRGQSREQRFKPKVFEEVVSEEVRTRLRAIAELPNHTIDQGVTKSEGVESIVQCNISQSSQANGSQ